MQAKLKCPNHKLSITGICYHPNCKERKLYCHDCAHLCESGLSIDIVQETIRKELQNFTQFKLNVKQNYDNYIEFLNKFEGKVNKCDFSNLKELNDCIMAYIALKDFNKQAQQFLKKTLEVQEVGKDILTDSIQQMNQFQNQSAQYFYYQDKEQNDCDASNIVDANQIVQPQDYEFTDIDKHESIIISENKKIVSGKNYVFCKTTNPTNCWAFKYLGSKEGGERFYVGLSKKPFKTQKVDKLLEENGVIMISNLGRLLVNNDKSRNNKNWGFGIKEKDTFILKIEKNNKKQTHKITWAVCHPLYRHSFEIELNQKDFKDTLNEYFPCVFLNFECQIEILNGFIEQIE